MIVLPLEPAYQAGDRLLFALAGHLDAERITGVAPHSAGEPPAVPLLGANAIRPIANRQLSFANRQLSIANRQSPIADIRFSHTPNLPGPTAAIKGSIRFSSSASATT